MKNEIKVGEYIRTKDGIIDKIVDISDTYSERKLIALEKSNSLMLDIGLKTRVVKHSSNLIDIIEAGDYVNNCRVVEHAYQKGRLFVTYLYIGGKVITTTEDYSWELTKDREDWIKSIVTKEQFESVSYKVEE